MLYAYKTNIDNKNATVVSAADTTEEYKSWENKLPETSKFWNERHVPAFFEMLSNKNYKGFKTTLNVFFHDENTQKSFFDHYNIKEVPSMSAVDKQKDMLYLDSEQAAKEKKEQEKQYAEAFGDEYKEKTLAEIHGLEENDPWSKETKFDINSKPNAFKETSGYSFGSVKDIKENRENSNTEANDDLRMDRVTAEFDSNGIMTFKDVLAHKRGETKEFSLFDDDDLDGWDEPKKAEEQTETPEQMIKEEDMAKVKVEYNKELKVDSLPINIKPIVEKVSDSDTIWQGIYKKDWKVDDKIIIVTGPSNTAVVDEVIETNDLKEIEDISFGATSAKVYQIDGNNPFAILKAAYSYKILRIE